MADLPSKEHLYRLADVGGGAMRMESVANPAWHSTYDGEWVRADHHAAEVARLNALMQADAATIVKQGEEIHRLRAQLRSARETEPDLGGCSIACGACGVETLLRYTDRTKKFVSITSVEGWTVMQGVGIRCPSCSVQKSADDPSEVTHGKAVTAAEGKAAMRAALASRGILHYHQNCPTCVCKESGGDHG